MGTGSLAKDDIKDIAESVGLTYPIFAAFLEVESGGNGFSPTTGKLIIQFEPHVFDRYLTEFKIDHTITSRLSGGRRTYSITSMGETFTNGVEGQTAEWSAFNVAFRINPTAAMLSTSIGLPQIMGFHFARIGFDTVDAMWDAFKTGERSQVAGLAKFIKTDSRLLRALKNKDWATVAKLYNGAGYKINKYDEKLKRAYERYLRLG